MFTAILNFLKNLFGRKGSDKDVIPTNDPIVNNNVIENEFKILPSKPIDKNDWIVLSNGSGEVKFGAGSVHLIPKAATLTVYGTNNEFGAWIISKAEAKNFIAEIEVNNIKQLRQNLPPRNFEVFWFFFNYTPENNLKKKTNYFIHKTTHGLEIGKAFDTYGQTFIETPPFQPVEMNRWYKYSIMKKNQYLSIKIDSVIVFEKDISSNPAERRLFDISGSFGLYSEDAYVNVRSFNFQYL